MMSEKVINTLKELDFSFLDQSSRGEIVDVLLQKIPDITGLIEKAAKDKEQRLQNRLQDIKQEVINGTCSTERVEGLLGSLSEQYTHLLSQLGVVETQLEQVESMRVKLEDKVHGIRMATLPIVLMLDFVQTLKQCSWAHVFWDEKNGTKSERITDYARLVDIFIEPNIQWSEKVSFKMLMGGYLPEADYNILIESLNIRAPYNIPANRSPQQYG